jgi:hypothetical protein
LYFADDAQNSTHWTPIKTKTGVAAMTKMLIDFISLLIIFLTRILLLVSQGRHSALMAINMVT